MLFKMQNSLKSNQLLFFVWGTFYGLTIPKYGMIYFICSLLVISILGILYFYKCNIDNSIKPMDNSNLDIKNQKSPKTVLFTIVSFVALITYFVINFLKSI